MAVTDTDTVREICTDALREASVLAIDDPATAEEMGVALRALNRMLKGWQNAGHNLWTRASISVTATTSAVYTLDPVRPHAIDSVRFKRDGLEIPMIELTRDEYDTLPNKASTGIPTQWYFDRQREAARLYVWPVLASAGSETLEITYHREIEDLALGDDIDVPGEWYEAVVYGLAMRLCNSFKVPNVPALLPGLAAGALSSALANDREGSVFLWSEDS